MSIGREDLSSQLRRDIEERNRQLEEARLNAANQANIDADRARRVLAASSYTGLPPEVVDADLENLESSILARDFDVDEYKSAAPAYTQFLAENPYHLAALRDDFENMGAIERSLKQISLGWDATWAQVEMGQLQNARMAQGGDFTPEQQERYDSLAELQVDHDFGSEGFTRFLVKNAKMAGPTLYSLGEGLELGLGGAMVGGTSALIAGQMGPQVAAPEELLTVPAATLTGFNIGMTTGTSMAAFELESGFAYGEYRDMGVDHETALMAARSVGVINAGLETIAIGKVVKYVPWLRDAQGAVSKRLAGDVLTQPTVRRATANFVVRYGEVLGTEIVTEALQESVTSTVGTVISGQEFSYEEFAARIGHTMLETLQGAAILSSLGPTMSYYSDVRRARDAERMGAVYEQLVEATTNSTTRQNLRGTYEQWLQRLKDQNPDGNIWIDGRRFAEYFQENNRDPEGVAAAVGIDAEQLQEAIELGQDIAIPTEKFAGVIAPTQAGRDLVMDVKANENAMSVREAELFRANNPGILKKIEELAAQAGDTRASAAIDGIVNDAQGQLVAAGYSTRAAGQLAQVMRGIGVMAEREGMDATELYERIFGGVRRVTPEAVARRDDVDMFVDPLLDRLRGQNFPSQREMFGPSLMDFINDIGGIRDEGGELAAMDFNLAAQERGVSKAKLARWAKSENTLATVAERAAEAGYIASRDENMLLEALDREIRGDMVYGNQGGSQGLQDLNRTLDELAGFIADAGLDIEAMTNQEIRDALEKSETFMQIDLEELRMLTDIVMQEVFTQEQLLDEQAGTDIDADRPTPPDQYDTMLARAAAMLPLVNEQQDFGGITLEESRTIAETGDTAKVRVPAQRRFDQAVKRKNVLKRLLDCVSG